MTLCSVVFKTLLKVNEDILSQHNYSREISLIYNIT